MDFLAMDLTKSCTLYWIFKKTFLF